MTSKPVYSLNVVNYLLKPIALARFMQACNKVLELYHLKHGQGQAPTQEAADYSFSYIIAIVGISSIRKNSIFIGDMELPVGETYRDSIAQLTKRNI
jgi:hypothetical protein